MLFLTKIIPRISKNVMFISNNYASINMYPLLLMNLTLKSISTSISPIFGNNDSLFKTKNNYNLISIRTYAKGKDKKKEKGKSKVTINEDQIAEVVNIETLKTQMQKAVSHMEEDFVKHLSLRSTTGAIESIPVNVDGKEHTLQELAQIVRKNPKTIVVNFAVYPQAIPAALKALSKSGMNLNPQQDGTTLFIPIPKVTKEHREQLSKNAKQIFIKCKDSVRDVQLKFVKQVKRQDKLSEDIARNVEQQIVAVADRFIADAESMLTRKQTELLGDK